jgi:hypothetical protein
MIFDLLKMLNNNNKTFTKKYQKKMYKKHFDIFKIFILFNNIFDCEDNKLNIKLLDIFNKMFNSIFIDNLGIIKYDKQLMKLIGKYNVIIKKKNDTHKKIKDDYNSNDNNSTSSENSN